MKNKFHQVDIASPKHTKLKGILKKDKRENFQTECEYATIVDLFHDDDRIKGNQAELKLDHVHTVDNVASSLYSEPSKYWDLSKKSSNISNTNSEDDCSETIALSFRENSFAENESRSWAPRKKLKKKVTNEELGLGPPENVRYAKRGVRLEAYAAIINLVVLLLCIIITALMAKLSNDWANRRRRCPIYVKSSPSIGIYWGNEHMLACSYSAYVPIVNLIISLSTLSLNSSIASAYWRKKNLSKLLFSRRYANIMSLIHIFNASIMLSVACVLTDGLRQTCLSFQLNPWAENRPDSCKLGYADRDDAYHLHGTYSKIFVSLIFSWLSTILLLVLVFLYFTRSKFCR